MKEKNHKVLLLFLLLSTGFSFGQSILSTTLFSTEDAYTRSGTGAGTNFGAADSLVVTSSLNTILPTVTYSASRSFVKFDLSTIPTNAIITSAKLRLSSKGTDPIAAANSSELYVELANSTWAEGTITHNTGISNNTLGGIVTTSNLVPQSTFLGTFYYREFNVKAQLQGLVEQRIPNHGWRIRRNPETGILTPAVYHSKESAATFSTFLVPRLEVSYYIPMSVSSAIIVQATTTTSTDGSISPTLADGSSTSKTYQWFSSTDLTTPIATTLNLSGVKYGWYGLKVTGTDPSDVMYYAFIIGVKCATVNVVFNPGNSDYIDDAAFYNYTSGSGNTAIFNSQRNIGTGPTLTAAEQTSVLYESLLRFRIWFDPNLTVNSANLTLAGNGHAPTDRPNTSYLKYVNEQWAEMSVAFSNKPASVTSPMVTITGTAAGNGSSIVNIATLINSWKLNNTQNYGCHMQLTFYEGSNTMMQFYSSDGTGTKPSLTMNLTSTNCGTNTNLFYVPKDVVGPEIADLRNSDKTLRIRYKDYFDVDGYVNYSIVCLTDDSVIGISLVPKDANTNWITINLNSAGLVIGNVYLLELIDRSGRKEYLKFKVVNS
ncbi:hypothetical protein D3C71_656820 [compost metagenome]